MRARQVLLVLGGLALGCAHHRTRDEATSPRVVKVPRADGQDSPRPSGPRAVAQIGHSGEIWAIAWSPDGQRVATGSFDHTIRIWSEQGRLLGVLAGHREAIVDLEWSPTGDVLGSTARDATTRLWDLRHAGKHRKLEKTGDHLAFSPSGERVATVGFDLVVRVFDAKSGAPGQSFIAPRGRQLRAVAWSSDGKRIAASALDGPLYVWDAEGGAMVTDTVGAGGALQELSFSPDGRWLASAGSGFSLLDITTGERRRLTRTGVNPYHATFSSDGTKLVTNGSAGHVHVWDVASAKYERSFPHPGYVSAVAAKPRSTLVAVGGKVPIRSPDGGNVEIPVTRIYDLASGKQTAHLEGTARPVELGSWSPKGDTLLTGSPELVAWDAYSGERRRVLHPPGGLGADWNPTRPLLAIMGRGMIRVMDSDTAKVVATIRQDEPSSSWSPDGATLAVCSFDSLSLWDVASKKTRRLPISKAGIWDVAFTPDSSQIAVATSVGIDAYGVKSGRLEKSYPLKGRVRSWTNAEQLVFGPSGTLAATLNGTGMVLFDANGAFLDLVEDRSRFAAPAFTPDGKRLAYASKDDIRIWGAADRIAHVGHDHVIRSITWSPDGARFASSSDDQSVRLWKPGRAQPIRTFPTYDGRVWSVSWHPSGKALLGVGNEVMIHLLGSGETLRMVTSLGATGAAWFTDSGEYAGDERALGMVVLRKSDDLLDPSLLGDSAGWKRRPELLSQLEP